MGVVLLFLLVTMTTGILSSVFGPDVGKIEPPPLPPTQGNAAPPGAVAKPGSNPNTGSTNAVKPPEHINIKDHLQKSHKTRPKIEFKFPSLEGLTPGQIREKLGTPQTSAISDQDGASTHTFKAPGNIRPPPKLSFPPIRVPIK